MLTTKDLCTACEEYPIKYKPTSSKQKGEFYCSSCGAGRWPKFVKIQLFKVTETEHPEDK